MAKSKKRQIKEETVASLVDKLGRTKTVILVDYRGLTTPHLAELRTQLFVNDAELSITKNTLLSRALAKAGFTTETLEGPTATVFAYGDEIAPIATVAKYLKNAGIGEAKLAFLNKEQIEKQTISRLAVLPTKEELIGKLIGSLSSPLYGIVGVLEANLRGLVFAVGGIRANKA